MRYENPWEHNEEWEAEEEKTKQARAIWATLDQRNQAKLILKGVVPFDDILAIDEYGDDETDTVVPHVFVRFGPNNVPFASGEGRVLAGPRSSLNLPEHKVRFFSDLR